MTCKESFENSGYVQDFFCVYQDGWNDAIAEIEKEKAEKINDDQTYHGE